MSRIAYRVRVDNAIKTYAVGERFCTNDIFNLARINSGHTDSKICANLTQDDTSRMIAGSHYCKAVGTVKIKGTSNLYTVYERVQPLECSICGTPLVEMPNGYRCNKCRKSFKDGVL